MLNPDLFDDQRALHVGVEAAKVETAAFGRNDHLPGSVLVEAAGVPGFIVSRGSVRNQVSVDPNNRVAEGNGQFSRLESEALDFDDVPFRSGGGLVAFEESSPPTEREDQPYGSEEAHPG